MRTHRTLSPLARAASWLAAGTLAVGLSGCDLLDQLKAKEMAVATLVTSPELENPKTGEKIAGYTKLSVMFGRMEGGDDVLGKLGVDGDSDSKKKEGFQAVKGAKVKLSFEKAGQAVTVDVPDKGDGKYELDTATDGVDPKFEYVGDAKYTLSIEYDGKKHKMEVKAPGKAAIQEFAQANPLTHEAGQPFTVTRGAAGDEVAFVSLASLEGATPTEVWSNDAKASGLVSLAGDDSKGKQTSYEIPGDKFVSGKEYLVTLSLLTRGEASKGDDPLFVTSSFFAGSADGGGILVP